MGIKYLKSSILKLNPAKKVDLRKWAIDLKKQSHCPSDPVLLVDLYNVHRALWTGLDFAGGGQHKHFEVRVKLWVQTLTEVGFKLVFVADGVNTNGTKCVFSISI